MIWKDPSITNVRPCLVPTPARHCVGGVTSWLGTIFAVAKQGHGLVSGEVSDMWSDNYV